MEQTSQLPSESTDGLSVLDLTGVADEQARRLFSLLILFALSLPVLASEIPLRAEQMAL